MQPIARGDGTVLQDVPRPIGGLTPEMEVLYKYDPQYAIDVHVSNQEFFDENCRPKADKDYALLDPRQH